MQDGKQHLRTIAQCIKALETQSRGGHRGFLLVFSLRPSPHLSAFQNAKSRKPVKSGCTFHRLERGVGLSSLRGGRCLAVRVRITTRQCPAPFALVSCSPSGTPRRRRNDSREIGRCWSNAEWRRSSIDATPRLRPGSDYTGSRNP
jgi:hypothetical protein